MASPAAQNNNSPDSLKRRVPVELEPLRDLEKGTMSDTLWKELNDQIQFEAISVQATGVIVPSPARKRNANGTRSIQNSPSPNENNNNKNQQQQGSNNNNNFNQDENSAIAARLSAQRFPAMERFFNSLATMGTTKASFRGLALLHNAAQLGVWHSNATGSTAQLRYEAAERAAAKSQAIDESLRAATDRAAALRGEQTRELQEQRDKKDAENGVRNTENDAYLKDLQRSRIDAEFERMRDQLRAEDAARREQLEYARQEKAKAAAEQDLAERKRKMREERDKRHAEREERMRELRAQETRALHEIEHALREKEKLQGHAAGAGKEF